MKRLRIFQMSLPQAAPFWPRPIADRPVVLHARFCTPKKRIYYLVLMSLKKSFAPIVPSPCTLLLLGSLPGDRSISDRQYYAHPQNRFWKVLCLLFGQQLPADYPSKLQILHQHGIALWDVCQTALRKGSMDTDILEEVPNPIVELLTENPAIKTICFNGQKAEKLYDKHFQRLPTLLYITLPSTSPANASFTLERLSEKWKVILDALV